MRYVAFLLLALPLLIAASTPSQAGAIAAAEAYNSNGELVAYEWCVKSKLKNAKACAIDACEQNGGEECSIAEYCDPSKWAAVVTMTRKDGAVAQGLVCERASRASIFVEVRKRCAEFRDDDTDNFKQCNVLTVISPDGDATPNTTRYRWRNGGLRAD